MEKRQTKEALLRHLLDAENSESNDIYAYLLGHRLFQSPEQLLKEIKLRLDGKESADIAQRYLRRSRKSNARPLGTACCKCQKRQEKTMISKSTNMLDQELSTTFGGMVQANVKIQAAGRQLQSVSNADSQITLSPAASSEISSAVSANSTDFDGFAEMGGIVFDEDNRRNTAPPAALNAISSPQKLRLYSRSAEKGTDFSTRNTETTFDSIEKLGVLLESSPETKIDDVPVADGVVASGEDTIRRRKKGRRRTTVTDLEILSSEPVLQALKEADAAATDRRSVASRDSGILSGVLDHEIDIGFHNNNNNNTKRNTSNESKHESTPNGATSSTKTADDSGFKTPTSPSVTDKLEQLSKDIEAQICSHLCDEKVVPNDPHARQRHLLHVLLVWARDFPSDFDTNEAMGTLKGLISSLEKDCQDLKDHCARVLDTLSESANSPAAQKKHFSQADVLAGVEDYSVDKERMICMVTGMSDVGDAHKMAEQLCLIEMDLLSRLGAEEFLQILSSDREEDSRTNLGESVRWFNRLSHLVATSVCLCRKPKHRRQVISLFTRAAGRCYELSNFNSAMAILTGLSLGAVARLKRTWSKVDTKEMEKLQSIFDPSNNFRQYRKEFNHRWAAMRSQQEAEEVKLSPVPENNRYSTASQHSVTSRSSVASLTSQHRDSGIECENESAASSRKSPDTATSSASSPKSKFTFDNVTSKTGVEDGVLVPFLTLMVKDVYFLNHSTPTIESDGTINFEKLRHLGEILHPLETWKHNPCVYEKNEELQDFLLKSPVMKDADLYNLSYKREPPKNKFEKDQLKKIKAEIEYSKRGNVVRRMIARRKTM